MLFISKIAWLFIFNQITFFPENLFFAKKIGPCNFEFHKMDQNNNTTRLCVHNSLSISSQNMFPFILMCLSTKIFTWPVSLIQQSNLCCGHLSNSERGSTVQLTRKVGKVVLPPSLLQLHLFTSELGRKAEIVSYKKWKQFL